MVTNYDINNNNNDINSNILVIYRSPTRKPHGSSIFGIPTMITYASFHFAC